ncbi:MAG: PaaI family thioesterase [Pseudomonadota bacterium]
MSQSQNEDGAALQDASAIDTARPNVTFGTVPAAQASAMSGLAFMRAMLDGTLPHPTICAAMNFRLIEVEPGRVVFAGAPTPQMLNPLAGVHGGVHATLLDSCMACASHTTLEPGELYTTLEMKVSYVRGVTAQSGRLIATGTVLHRGRQIITSEGRLETEEGKLVAHGSETCLVLKAP